MNKKIGRKGQVFTLIAIAIITLLFVSFSVYSTLRSREAINERVKTMDSFLFSVEEDLERQMYIVGYRLIILAQDKIIKGDTTETYFNSQDKILKPEGYIDNIQKLLEDNFFDTSHLTEDDLFYGVRRIDLIELNDDSVNEKAEKMNIHVDTDNYNIVIEQDDSWHIKITFEFDLVMEDESGLARWEKRENIITKIPIENFVDPLYLKNTNIQAEKIKKAPDCTSTSSVDPDPCVDSNGNIKASDVSKILEYAEEGYYSQHDDAPSFLMRLQGMTGADANGIERLIDVRKLPQEVVSANEGKSIVGHEYFDLNGEPGCKIDGITYNWFRIDVAHLDKYGVGCSPSP